MHRDHDPTLTAYTADVLANLTSIVEINARGQAGWRLYNDSASSVVLTIYDAPWHSSENRGVQFGTPAGTFTTAYDSATGSAISMTIAAHSSLDIPAALFACGAFKIVCAAGAASIYISPKS
jgi:hypothetical protein